MVGGTLDEFGLKDLIQVYCTTRQTARLTLTYPQGKAQIYFDQGEIVHAQFGDLVGVPAIQAAARLRGGDFHVDLGSPPPDRTIAQSWTSVVVEAIGVSPQAVRPPTRTATNPMPAIPPPVIARPTAVPTPPQGTAAPRSGPVRTPGPVPAAAPLPAPSPSREPAPRIVPPEPPRPSRNPAAYPAPPVPIQSASSNRALLLTGIGLAIVALAAGLVWYLRSRGSPPVVVAPKPAAKLVNPVITLGMSAAMTGPAKELGRQMRLGVETCLNAVNEAGGINGHKFELVALDDGYEPDRTRETMKELVEQRNVFAIVGNVGTPTAEVSVPYVLEKKVPFFGAFTGAGLLRKEPPDRYVFNYRASYVEETAAVVRYLVEVRKVKPKEIAVFAQQDGFGDAGFLGVTKALRRYGRNQDQILRVGFKRNTLEIGDAVAEILKNRNTIRAVVMVAPYRPAARFIEKLKEAKFEPFFTNVSFVGSTALAEELRQLGPAYSNGVIVTQVVPPVDSSAKASIRYREALAKYFRGEKPDFVSLEGYIAANVLMEGFRRAGKEPTRESLIDALESIHGLDLGIGTPITFGLSEHQGSHKIWGTVLDEKANYQVFDME